MRIRIWSFCLATPSKFSSVLPWLESSGPTLEYMMSEFMRKLLFRQEIYIRLIQHLKDWDSIEAIKSSETKLEQSSLKFGKIFIFVVLRNDLAIFCLTSVQKSLSLCLKLHVFVGSGRMKSTEKRLRYSETALRLVYFYIRSIYFFCVIKKWTTAPRCH